MVWCGVVRVMLITENMTQGNVHGSVWWTVVEKKIPVLFLALQTLVEQLPQDDPDYDVDLGCLLFKEGEYEEACKKFISSMQVLGYQPGEHHASVHTSLKGIYEQNWAIICL